MLVKMTEMPARTQLWIEATAIRGVGKDQKNPLQTLVILNIMTPQGLQSIAVTETPDELGSAINSALAGKDLSKS